MLYLNYFFFKERCERVLSVCSQKGGKLHTFKQRNWLKGFCTVRTFEGHMQGISCVKFDDTSIVSGSSDKTIKL